MTVWPWKPMTSMAGRIGSQKILYRLHMPVRKRGFHLDQAKRPLVTAFKALASFSAACNKRRCASE